ncbi:hypothetical protein BJF78_29585 [Pseudonocardia sp. CNS-139]|nr:hypothetical protein BJF78_29585 [Pseudonocardia sp. CNS-139]
MISLRQDVRAGCVVVTVAGEVDMVTAGRLRHAVGTALADAGTSPVVIDLTGVSFLGSHGLAVLLEARRAAVATLPLRVVVDSTRPVIRPMQVSGVAELLTLFHDVDDAVAGRPELDA